MGMLRAYQKPSGKKINRKPGHAHHKSEHEAWLRSMGINPDKKIKRKVEKLVLVPTQTKSVTSDTIPGNGSKKDSITYTGNEIAGVALMHKQNYTPVRKDNKKSAIEISQMRRN